MKVVKLKAINDILNTIEINCQSSIRIEDELVIYFDPYDIKEARHDANYIFITHPHWDHFNIEAIDKLRNETTTIIGPNSIIKQLPQDWSLLEVEVNQTYQLESLSFQTIPAYNLEKNFHPKEADYVGYLIKLQNITYYIPGDTDIIEENKTIKADVIFLPVGGIYTMDKIEATSLANSLNPKVAIPIHYGLAVGSLDDAIYFKEHLKKSIDCKIYY